MTQDEKKAIEVSKQIYASLSIVEKYAIIAIFSAFRENIRGNIHSIAEALYQIELEENALGVKLDDAEMHFKVYGSEGIPHIMSLVCEIKKKNKDIVDFLVYRSYSLVKKACGIHKGTGIPCEIISKRLFYNLYGSLGYTKDELNLIINNPTDLVTLYGH